MYLISYRRQPFWAYITPMTTPSAQNNSTLAHALATALAEHAHKEGSLLPILHSIQDQLGYIPSEIILPLSQAIQRSRAEIHGVISFYAHFRTQPPAALHLAICRAEACQARGANALIAHAQERLGCDFHQRSQTHDVHLEPAYCLGLCAQGPAAMLNEQPVAHVTPHHIDEWLNQVGESA